MCKGHAPLLVATSCGLAAHGSVRGWWRVPVAEARRSSLYGTETVLALNVLQQLSLRFGLPRRSHH